MPAVLMMYSLRSQWQEEELVKMNFSLAAIGMIGLLYKKKASQS